MDMNSHRHSAGDNCTGHDDDCKDAVECGKKKVAAEGDKMMLLQKAAM